MAWIRGLCLQIHLLSVTWGCFRLLLLWQCRSCLQLSPQHWSCSKASCKTSLGQHWGKYLTCPAPEHGCCGAGGSQGSWAGMPAQGAPSCGQRVCPVGQAVSWGTRSHGHRWMPSEGSPCAMSQETQGARGWNSQRWTRTDGEGSCTPLRAGTSVPKALGLRGWLEARSQQPCFSQPSHPLPGPEKAPRLEVPLLWQQGQMAGTTRAQRSSGQAEPWGSAAEAGHCPPPPDVSCLRSRHGLGAARS